jgi:GNAT superfamily N-acetyltransferase
VEEVTARGSDLEIQRAQPDAANTLTRIASAAKAHWGYPEQWMERWRDALTITPEFIRRNEVHVGEGRRIELEHLWVLPERMGAGVGRALFEHAVRTAASLGAGVVGIEADPNAEGFYRRMGARRVGEIVYEIDGRERVLPLLAMYVQAPS